MPDPASSSLPPAARALRDAVSAAVQGRAEAVHALAESDPEQVRVLVGHVLRHTLEDAHPDGLDGDDIAGVLRRAVAETPSCDPEVLTVVLAGALGVLDPDELPSRPSPHQIAEHATVVLRVVLAGLRRPVDPYLVAALAEIERAETVELP